MSTYVLVRIFNRFDVMTDDDAQALKHTILALRRSETKVREERQGGEREWVAAD